jgi:hypothetical protein
MLFDPIDVIALVLGIWMTVRKLDVRRREPEQYPEIARDGFERWKTLASSAYTFGSTACFAKLCADFALRIFGPRAGLPWPVIRALGLALFVGWIAALVVTWVRARRAGRLQDELGIRLGPRAPAQGPEP